MEAGRNVDQEICFNFLKLPSSQWSDHFISVLIAESDFDVLTREIEVLKPKVREHIFALPSRDNDTIKKQIHSVHLLDSLGLSYHFENDIKEILKYAFEKIEDLIADENDLYTISIMFRVFRRYGYNMSSDVFKRFKGNDGNFKESLLEDVKGILSFYEAVHFETTTDHILDEALSFTLNHLEPLATCCTTMPPHVSKLIQNSLHIPQHRNTPSLVAREYISFYEQEEDRDDTLLKLAKLNFNLLRLRYFQELKTITKWWREVSHSLNLPHHFKERTIEAWFSALMMYFEPKFSLERIITTKLIQVMTFLDQACDVYGSVPEVESLVDCLERWDPDYMENLQGHMKTVFKFVMCFFKECGDALELQGRSFVLEMLKEEFMQYTRASLKLLKWAQGSHVPSFGDFMEVGGTGVGNDTLIACCIMGLEEIGGKEAFEWLRLRPKLVQAFGAKLRILDDITDFEFIFAKRYGGIDDQEDMGSGYTANGVNYYMNEHEVTKEEANRELEKMIGDINKIANEECLNMTTTMPHRNIMQAVRFGRAMDVLYIGDDVYNNRDGKLKEYMNSLLVDPIRY